MASIGDISACAAIFSAGRNRPSSVCFDRAKSLKRLRSNGCPLLGESSGWIFRPLNPALHKMDTLQAPHVLEQLSRLRSAASSCKGWCAMRSLVEALERFNRKERNLLVRDATGNKASLLQGSPPFRRRIADALGLQDEIPDDAWWATDYHIAWLAGALSVYALGDGALEQIWPNPKVNEKTLSRTEPRGH